MSYKSYKSYERISQGSTCDIISVLHRIGSGSLANGQLLHGSLSGCRVGAAELELRGHGSLDAEFCRGKTLISSLSVILSMFSIIFSDIFCRSHDGPFYYREKLPFAAVDFQFPPLFTTSFCITLYHTFVDPGRHA